MDEHGVPDISWNLCILCQEETNESVKEPAKSKNKEEVIHAIYNDTVRILKEFATLPQLPNTLHPVLSTYSLNDNFSDMLIENKAMWHGSCKAKVTQTKLEKYKLSIKRKLEAPKRSPVEAKKTRSSTARFDQNSCFIPGCTSETSDENPLHDVMSKELDARFREYAEILNHTELLAKLSGGDLIAQEAKYHSSCAVMFYNSVRSKLREQETPVSQDIRNYENIAFLHLVSDVEEFRYDTAVSTFVLSIFKLKRLFRPFSSAKNQYKLSFIGFGFVSLISGVLVSCKSFGLSVL